MSEAVERLPLSERPWGLVYLVDFKCNYNAHLFISFTNRLIGLKLDTSTALTSLDSLDTSWFAVWILPYGFFTWYLSFSPKFSARVTAASFPLGNINP